MGGVVAHTSYLSPIPPIYIYIYIGGEKSVMWRNFRIQYMTDVEKSKISPHVEEFENFNTRDVEKFEISMISFDPFVPFVPFTTFVPFKNKFLVGNSELPRISRDSITCSAKCQGHLVLLKQNVTFVKFPPKKCVLSGYTISREL